MATTEEELNAIDSTKKDSKELQELAAKYFDTENIVEVVVGKK